MLKRGGHSFALGWFFFRGLFCYRTFFAWFFLFFVGICLLPVVLICSPFILLFCVWKIIRNSTGAVEILKQNSDGKVFKESKGFFGKLENELEKLGNKLIKLSGKLKKSKSDDEAKPKKPKSTNKSKPNERKDQ